MPSEMKNRKSEIEKMSLEEAAIELETLCEKVANANELTPELIDQFDTANLTVASEVDRRVKHFVYLKSQIDLAAERAASWQKRKQVCERLMSSLKERTLKFLDSSKLKLSGNHSQLYSQLTPPALKLEGNLAFIGKDKKRFVPAEEVTQETYTEAAGYFIRGYELDTQKLKKDLDDGAELPFAKLEQSRSVRWRI